MFVRLYDQITAGLMASGQWLALLGLRALLAYEFWTAGYGKLSAGSEAPRWFANQEFVFPFGLLSANTNWFMVTWGELLAAVAIALGLFTRFFAFSLLVITVVAIAAVHWPGSWDSLGQLWEGYSVSRVMEDREFRGNFRIPLLFLAMILPLIFFGGGKLSVDHLVATKWRSQAQAIRSVSIVGAFGLAGLVLGVMTIYLLPTLGAALLVGSLTVLAYEVYQRYQAGTRLVS